MNVALSYNPVMKFMNSFIAALRDKSYCTETPDDLLLYILRNNSCAFTDNPVMGELSLSEMNYYIDFIKGGKANDANDYFDYIEINGSRGLIIFLDYFDGLVHKKEPKNDIDRQAMEFMGNSNYFDAISRLTSIFLNTTYAPGVFTNALSASSAGQYVRKIPQIVAAKIIYEVAGEFNENDSSDFMPHEELMRFNTDNSAIVYALHGVYLLND